MQHILKETTTFIPNCSRWKGFVMIELNYIDKFTEKHLWSHGCSLIWPDPILHIRVITIHQKSFVVTNQSTKATKFHLKQFAMYGIKQLGYYQLYSYMAHYLHNQSNLLIGIMVQHSMCITIHNYMNVNFTAVSQKCVIGVCVIHWNSCSCVPFFIGLIIVCSLSYHCLFKDTSKESILSQKLYIK